MSLTLSTILALADVSAFSAGAASKVLVPESTPSPQWSTPTGLSQGLNASYLNSTTTVHQTTIDDLIFIDPGSNRRVRKEYDTRVANYERRRDAGLTNIGDDQLFHQDMKNFANDQVRNVGKSHGNVSLAHFRHGLENNAPAAREPIAVAVFAAAIYSGRPVRVKVAREVRLESSVNFRDRNSTVQMFMPGLTSGLNYSATSGQGVTASVSKSIDKNFSANVDSSSHGTLSLIYGLSF